MGKEILRDVPINDLIPYDKNYLNHDNNREFIKNSIGTFDFTTPIEVDENMVILAGHGRLEAAKMLNMETIPFVLKISGWDEAKKTAYRYANNSTAKEAQIIFDNVEYDLDIIGDDYDLGDFGFDMEAKELAPEVVEDEAPEAPEEPKTRRGDIYELGNHRVMCGDSTIITDVEKLMDGKKADMVFTSPPYNVGHNLGYKDKTSKYLNSDDNLSEYKKLIVDSTSLAIQYAKEVFINIQLLANNKKDVLLFLSELVDYFKDIFFWKKLQVAPAMAENVANSQVELILLFGQNNSRAWGNMKWRGNFSNYIETKSASGENENSKIHNATFPLALPLKFIEHAYAPKSIVLDIFCGSGTTLIACEQTNRICYGMELDEKYCDVIVQRYVNFTGNTKIKLNGEEIEWQTNKT